MAWLWRWRWRWRWPFTEVGRQIGQANGSDGSDEEEYGKKKKKKKKKKKIKTGKAAVLETKELALEQRMYYSQPSTATTSLRRRGGGGGGNSSSNGSNGSGVENGNGWLFDVWLREENGQQLERTTLEMVLSDELLAFPLGIFLRDLDVTAPSGTCTPLLLLASSTMDSAHTTIRVCTHMA